MVLTGGIQRSAHPEIRAAIVAGLLTGASIGTYTVWDKYAVSIMYVSPILLDLLANPVQASVANAPGLEPTSRYINLLEAKQPRAFRRRNSKSDFIYSHSDGDDRRPN